MLETILIVDDEESVRKTFRDWLLSGNLGCEVHAVGDAESALVFANDHPVDLAILDWNLGTGSDGLKLLEDLVEFHPDIVAILVTGFAHQATPLDALRMGVRDYLDKNQDLNRETFLNAVRRQLERIVPAKRQRQFTRSLFEFREAVEKILPLVQSSAAMNDPVPLPEAIRGLLRFMMKSIQASEGFLVARHFMPDGTETFLAFGCDGIQLPPLSVPFSRSLAATVVSMQEPCVMNRFDPASAGPIELQAFEKGRKNLLAAPMVVAPGTHVVLELFDKHGDQPFTEEDRRFVSTASEFGVELLRQAMAERQTRRTLIAAVGAALQASTSIVEGLPGSEERSSEDPPPASVMDRLKEGLNASGNALVDADTSIRLAEGVRVLALRHGPAAVRHCIRMVESLREVLDEATGG